MIDESFLRDPDTMPSIAEITSHKTSEGYSELLRKAGFNPDAAPTDAFPEMSNEEHAVYRWYLGSTTSTKKCPVAPRETAAHAVAMATEMQYFDKIEIWHNEEGTYLAVGLTKDRQHSFKLGTWGSAALPAADSLKKQHLKATKNPSYKKALGASASFFSGALRPSMMVLGSGSAAWLAFALGLPWLAYLLVIGVMGIGLLTLLSDVDSFTVGRVVTGFVGGIGIVGAIVAGLIHLGAAASVDRPDVLLVCDIDKGNMGADTASITTPKGEFSLNSGTYNGAWFDNPRDAADRLRKDTTYKVQRRGIISPSINKATPISYKPGSCG